MRVKIAIHLDHELCAPFEGSCHSIDVGAPEPLFCWPVHNRQPFSTELIREVLCNLTGAVGELSSTTRTVRRDSGRSKSSVTTAGRLVASLKVGSTTVRADEDQGSGR